MSSLINTTHVGIILFETPSEQWGMELDLTKTAAVFVALIAVGVGGLAASGVMQTSTVLMMVAPSMVAFGLICLFIGVKHGEYRAGATR